MPLCTNQCPGTSDECPDALGCPKTRCPDYTIKRNSTRPAFILSVSDCDGPLDLTDCVAEISMWAKAKIKTKIEVEDTYFSLVNDIGFEQSLVGDIIVVDRARAPEQMLVTGHDEVNKLIRVERGYNGTQIGAYKKNTAIKIFRVLNSIAEINMVEEDIEQIDGTTETELTDSQIVYNWQPNDTCLPGCYWLEIKLMKMIVADMWYMETEPVIPTFVSVSPTEAGCELGAGVEWVRKFPVSGAYLVKVDDSPINERLM